MCSFILNHKILVRVDVALQTMLATQGVWQQPWLWQSIQGTMLMYIHA